MLGGLVVGGQQRARPVGPDPVPPQLHDPLRVRVADRRALGRVVGGQLDALALDPAQDRVDDAVALTRLGELDGLGDRRVVRDARVEQLVEADPQRGADAGLEPALRELPGDPRQRPLALNRAVGEAHRQRALARIQVGGLAAERAIRERVLLEDAAHDAMRDHPGRARAHQMTPGTGAWPRA